MKKGFYFILFFLLSADFYAQTGTPFIKNFSPEEYGSEGQIWCAEQDYNGIMYFGSNSGILVFDGQTWQTIKLPNNSPVRSLCKDDRGIIFIGGVGEFGYLKIKKEKGFKYISLSQELDSLSRSFSDIWTMKSVGDDVWFASNEFLFRYNPKKIPATKKIETEKPPFLLYKTGNEVYVSIRGEGTKKLKGDSLGSVPGLEKTHPWFMLPLYETGKIIGDYYGLSIYNPNSDKELLNELSFNKEDIEKTNKFLAENQLYTGAVELGEGRYAIGTIREGVVIINKKGKIINNIDEDKGLQNNTIHYLFVDNQNELWACTAYGISRIDINSPYELFSKNDGIKGSIYDVLRFHNYFYVTSNLGLYYYSGIGFEGVDKLSGKDALQILSPFIFHTESDSLFFVNTIYGMYQIENNHPKKINSINYNSIIQSEFDKNTVFFTVNYDLYKMIYRNHSFSSAEKIDKFDDLLYVGIESEKDKIMLILNKKPILYNLKTKTSDSIRINAEINDINKIDDKIFAFTHKGLYVYNSESNQFIKDKTFLPELPGNIDILQFDKFSEHAYWLLGKVDNRALITEIRKKKGVFNAEEKPFKRLTGINVIHKDGDSILWALNSKTLYRYNIKNTKNFNRKEKCILREIRIKNNSLIFSGILTADSINLSKGIKTEYRNNDIKFNFVLTSYEGNKNEYSYKLENGKKGAWSDWTTVNFKEYTNLREGDYTFYVKGRNVYGVESDVVKYSFEILPPWHRTMYAYIVYLILLILLIWAFVKLNAKRLKKENLRLDNIVKERTAELLTQKEEIQTQADYLEDVNNELNQKNEEISTIAENLKEANAKINEKNKYIIDSINYAQKIQNAALPSEKEIAKHISDFFIIYKPKDIVSGDFYFVKKRGNYLIFAVADCTGHGVPGGFLAMMSMAVLSDVVQDTEISNPAAALEKMRKIIKQALHQNEYLESQNEGIEIALCALNTKNLSLEYAGANHPLFIGRKNEEESEIIEIEADPQPVGIHYREKPFNLQHVQLQENDMIYMFSDGYFDQFGGPDKKKFLLKNLKELLKKVSSESAKIQKRTITSEFNSWKGKNKQVDDVLMMGIRIKSSDYSE